MTVCEDCLNIKIKTYNKKRKGYCLKLKKRVPLKKAGFTAFCGQWMGSTSIVHALAGGTTGEYRLDLMPRDVILAALKYKAGGRKDLFIMQLAEFLGCPIREAQRIAEFLDKCSEADLKRALGKGRVAAKPSYPPVPITPTTRKPLASPRRQRPPSKSKRVQSLTEWMNGGLSQNLSKLKPRKIGKKELWKEND